MNYGVHWKLGNIPRQDKLWLRAIEDSVYPYISLDVCPEEHVASPGLELPMPNRKIKYNYGRVTPRTSLVEAGKAFLTFIMASTLVTYKDEIITFGIEWNPESFPFRELAFALLSIASDQAAFHSFPEQLCNSRRCETPTCNLNPPTYFSWMA